LPKNGIDRVPVWRSAIDLVVMPMIAPLRFLQARLVPLNTIFRDPPRPGAHRRLQVISGPCSDERASLTAQADRQEQSGAQELCKAPDALNVPGLAGV
jgi:hypothetical protein